MPGEFIARQGLISRGNVVVTGSLTTSGSLTTTGTITATTLVVQTITSSISSITGSTNFGSLVSNTHTFTGSILASGSVGIGITPFNNTLGPSLDMRNGVGLFGFGDATYLSGNLYFDSAWKVKNAGTGSQITLAGEIVFNTSNPTGSAGTNVTNTERMRITNSGNVGIGTSSPDRRLTIGGTTSAYMNFNATTYRNYVIGSDDVGFIVYDNFNSAYRFVINSSGNVGIGTTTPNAAAYAGRVLTIGNGTAYENALELNGYNITDDTLSDVAFLNGASSDADKRVCIIRANRNGANNSGALLFYTKNSGTFGERMRITSAGDVSIGTNTTNTNTKVKIKASSEGTGIGLSSSTLSIVRSATDTFLSIGYYSTPDAFVLSTSYGADGAYKPIAFATSDAERARFTNNGYFKARGSETSYYSATIPAHELRTGQGGEWNTIMTSTASDSYGLLIGLTPGLNNTGNELIAGYTGNFSTLKFKVASNGGIYNFTGNNVPLSDQRMKKEITPLESYWDKFKAIEMVKFKYINQEHDDFNIGVISQQIESIMPEFVDVWDEKNIPEDGKPLMGVYMEDLHNMTMKVLQEAMAKIEELETKLQDQQQTINSLINR